MAEQKKQKKPLYDIDRDRKNIEEWEELIDAVGPSAPRPQDEKTPRDQLFREDTKRVGKSFFGIDVPKSKDEQADEMFKEDKTDYKSLAETIKRTSPGQDTVPLTPAEIASFGPADQSPPAKESFTERIKKSVSTPTEEEEPTPPNTDDLAKELRAARAAYAADRDNLEKREAVETLANAIGKIGAGMAGLKSGTDMSGMKFDKQDWERKQDRTQRDFQTSLSDIESRRKEQIQGSQFSSEQVYRKSVLNETVRHHKAMEKLAGAAAASKGQQLIGSLNAKALAAYRSAVEKTSSELYQVAKDVESGKTDETLAAERIKSMLTTQLGIHPDRADELVMDRGWWDSMRSPDEIQSRVNAIAATQLGVDNAAEEVPEGQSLVLAPNGKTGYIPTTNLSTAVSQGYKVLK